MRRTPLLLAALTLAGAVLPAVAPASADAAAAAPRSAGVSDATTDRPIGYTQWDTGSELRTGTRSAVRVGHGRLVLTASSQHRRYQGTTYDVGTWTSPWVTPGFGATSLISSWSATTPRGSWIEVRARESAGTVGASARSRWQVMGRWTSGDRHLHRTSVPGQSGPLGRVDVDTWKAASTTGVAAYQLQVRLMRRTGSHAPAPSVDTVGAVAARLPAGVPPTSAPGVASAAGTVLPVPAYSQMVHRGEYPQWGGGGEAWCSPTSTSMVLGYYGRLPAASSYGWAKVGTDPWVDQAARSTYDASYEGTGNWPFNTAYAAPLAGHAFVTRLRSLAEVEQLIAAGIPVVVSVSFSSGGLTGAPISATAGHLIVVVGFTTSGDVVVNDPAASSASGVRRTYDRAQFEAAWLGGSGGTAYVIHDDAHPLPPSPGDW